MSDEAVRAEQELRQMRNVKAASSSLSMFKQMEKKVMEEEGKKGVNPPRPTGPRSFRPQSQEVSEPKSSAVEEAAPPPRRTFRRAENEVVNPLEVAPSPAEEMPSMPKRQFKRQPTESAAISEPVAAIPAEEVVPKRQFKRQPTNVVPEETPAPVEEVVPKRQFKRQAVTGLDIGAEPSPSSSSVDLESQQRDLQVQREKLEELRRDLQAKEKELSKKESIFEDEQAKLEEEKSDLNLQKTKFEMEKQQIVAQAAANNLSGKSNDELQELREELEEMREDLDAQREVFDRQREQFNATKQQVEADKIKFQEEKKVLEARVGELEKEKALLQQQRQALASERAAFNADKQKHISQSDQSSRGALQAVEDERLKLQAEREKFDKERLAFESQRSDLAAQLASLETQKALLANQKSELESQQASLALKQLKSTESPATSPRPTSSSSDSELVKKLERKNKELSKAKTELKKSKKLQLETVQQNNLLLAEMQKKDKAYERQEKKLQSEIKAQKAKLKEFFTEREQLKEEKMHWEETKMALEDVPAPLKQEGNWSDPKFVQERVDNLNKEKTKVNVIKRYVETERKRFLEVKRQFEQQQTEFLERKKVELETPMDKEEKSKSSSSKSTSSSSSTHKSGSSRSKSTKSSKTLHKKESQAVMTPATGTAPESSSDSAAPLSPVTPAGAVPSDSVPVSARGKEASKAPDPTPAAGMTSKGPVDLPAGFVTDVFDLDKYSVFALTPDQLKARIERYEEEDMASIRVDDQSGEIFSGGLRGLLRAIASQTDSEDYHTTLLMTHDYFLSAAQLMRVVILFYRAPVVCLTVQDAPDNQRRQVYQARLIDFLNLWQTLRFESLARDAEWQQLFREFVSFLQTPEGNTSHSIALSDMNHNLRQQWTFYRERQEALSLKTPFGPSNSVQLLYISAQQLAEQLTLREQSYFQAIDMSEYYNKSWEGGDSRAPHLSKLITRFADMSFWVATTILSAKDVDGKPSEKFRAQTISRFIHTLNELYTMNNFNTLMQLYTALNMPVIDRLRRSWSLVPKADKEILKKIGTLMHHSNNYKKYREALDAVEDEPCIPFHSLLLRDLTFMEEDVTFIDDQFVNFEKLTLISQIFERLQDFRLQLYDIEEDAAIQQFLHNKVVKTQEELDALSKSFNEEDGDASAESTPDVGVTEESLCRQYGITALSVAESLRVPELFQQFKQWLKGQDVADQNCLDCWVQLNDFVKADVGDSNYGALALKEMAEDIFSLFLTPEAKKYIGDVPEDITRELSDYLNSSSPVTKTFFDEVIAGVMERLDYPWNDFKNEALLKQ